MRFVRGSHKLVSSSSRARSRRASSTTKTDPSLDEVPDIDGNPDLYDVLSRDMEPGELLAFTSCTLHGASGTAPRRRAAGALTVRYTATTWPMRTAEHDEGARNPALQPGDPLDSDLFPVVWDEDGDFRPDGRSSTRDADRRCRRVKVGSLVTPRQV